MNNQAAISLPQNLTPGVAISIAKGELLHGEPSNDFKARVVARAWSILTGRNEADALGYIALVGVDGSLNECVRDLVHQLRA